MRRARDPDDFVIAVVNFTPVPRHGYVFGVPREGRYTELLNSDAAAYGGGNVGNNGMVDTDPIASHGYKNSVRLSLPPLGFLLLKPLTLDSSPGSSPTRPEEPASPKASARASRGKKRTGGRP